MSDKGGTYRITYTPSMTPEERRIVSEVNRIFALLEDRLDELEAIRGSQYFTTSRWEKGEV